MKNINHIIAIIGTIIFGAFFCTTIAVILCSELKVGLLWIGFIPGIAFYFMMFGIIDEIFRDKK